MATKKKTQSPQEAREAAAAAHEEAIAQRWRYEREEQVPESADEVIDASEETST